MRIMFELGVGDIRDREEPDPGYREGDNVVFLCFPLDMLLCNILILLFQLFVSFVILCIYMFSIDSAFCFKKVITNQTHNNKKRANQLAAA
jgi:hypothetical protein